MLDQRIQGLYGITPNNNLNIALIERVITEHQVNILQYRHKTNDDQLKLNEAQQLLDLCLTHNTLFIVNDDINLCEKVGADGVHLGQNDTSIKTAREQLGEKASLVYLATINYNLPLRLKKWGADYVAFGTLFNSITKPTASHCPLSVIKSAKEKLNLPIVGIGGITFDNRRLAFESGCDAVAMLNGLFS